MTRLHGALAGILAAVAGMATGHLVAAFTSPAASPLLAVGSAVIDLTPTPVKEWAVARFGAADKPILVGSVLVVTLVVAAGTGLLARRSRGLAAIGVSALGILAGVAVALRPSAAPVDLLPAATALVAGLLAMLGLTSIAVMPASPAPSRRFVLSAAGVAAGSVLAASIGEVRSTAGTARDVVLPRPAEPGRPLPGGLETAVRDISPLQTPAATFYRVDTNLTVPRVDVDRWRLEIDGMVRRPLALAFDELTALPLIERDITLTCVSNEVGGGYVGSARWLGVRLADVLDRAGVGGDADQVLSTAVDGFTISTPLAAILDGRDAMVAVGMNGKPLPEAHGFPARLVTPGLYGFVGATKWLTRLTLTTYAAERAYWTERQWATDAPIKTSSRIDTPKPLSTIRSGRVAIGGVAWAQHRGIGKVEVRVDEGPWQTATLGPDIGIDSWRQWYLPWQATPGLHRLAVRATDRRGETQTERRATPFPNGASGIQQVVVTVA